MNADGEVSSKDPAAVALGRLGGLVKSKVKADWARWNGRKGGRPRQATPSRGALYQRRRRERLRHAAMRATGIWDAKLVGPGDGARRSAELLEPTAT